MFKFNEVKIIKTNYIKPYLSFNSYYEKYTFELNELDLLLHEGFEKNILEKLLISTDLDIILNPNYINELRETLNYISKFLEERYDSSSYLTGKDYIDKLLYSFHDKFLQDLFYVYINNKDKCEPKYEKIFFKIVNINNEDISFLKENSTSLNTCNSIYKNIKDSLLRYDAQFRHRVKYFEKIKKFIEENDIKDKKEKLFELKKIAFSVKNLPSGVKEGLKNVFKEEL